VTVRCCNWPWLCRVAVQWPGVPDLHGRVPIGGSEPPPVGAERHPIDTGRMSLESERFLTGNGVPDPYRLVEMGRGEPPAVGAERNAPDTAGMPL
jgi:hypothetical protein